MKSMNLKDYYAIENSNLLNHYQQAAAFDHQGLVGGEREEFLEKFLAARLPQRIAVGKGQIIGTKSDERSKEADLVLYDHVNCPTLIAADRAKLFPVESVLAAIEVKSRLSKEKLLEGIDNIASVKGCLPEGRISRNGHPHVILGVIFAYDLAENSLESLEKNLREQLAGVDPWQWPDLVAVLNHGIIFQCDHNLHERIGGRPEPGDTFWMHIEYAEDTLFEFFIRLHDFLTDAASEDVYLRRYKELPKRAGAHFVTGHDGFRDAGGHEYRLSDEFIDKVYTYCKDKAQLTQRALLLKALGQLPQGSEGDESLDVPMYLYNPENLPGIPLGDIEKVIEIDRDHHRYRFIRPFITPHINIVIDGNVYWVPMAYTTDDVRVRVGK